MKAYRVLELKNIGWKILGHFSDEGSAGQAIVEAAMRGSTVRVEEVSAESPADAPQSITFAPKQAPKEAPA